jgi:arsenate reductase-like glutaredoxin family protein
MSCQKARGFLESQAWRVDEQADASKNRRSREEALALARTAETVVVAKGKKVLVFDMRKDPPDEDTLAAHLLGPTGNLRAPTLRRGRTLLVGFSEEAYQQVLGDG